jgi:hypothetical protein
MRLEFKAKDGPMFRTFENPHRGWEIIDSPRRSERSSDDSGRRDKVISESVV